MHARASSIMPERWAYGAVCMTDIQMIMAVPGELHSANGDAVVGVGKRDLTVFDYNHLMPQ